MKVIFYLCVIIYVLIADKVLRRTKSFPYANDSNFFVKTKNYGIYFNFRNNF